MTANELNRIVVGVDGSDCARRAAQWAAREADRRALPSLTLLHAYGGAEAIPPPLHQQPRAVQGAALLETAVAHLHDLHPTLALETELSPLDPVARLAELSRSGALIVTGTSGHGALAGLLLGSVSRALAATAPGPLVVVRGPRAGQDEGPVVLGVGAEPEAAENAVEYAFAAARGYGVPVHAVRAEVSRAADLDAPTPPALAPAGLSLLATRPPGPPVCTPHVTTRSSARSPRSAGPSPRCATGTRTSRSRSPPPPARRPRP